MDRSKSLDIHSENFFYQKLDYIHYNPVRAGYAEFPEQYKYLSACSYFEECNQYKWEFLTLF
ncbi:hypothetical protein [Membranihabitans maritimus]|uniref:hypothetical protein n=1 Tax=Membranihabitans maritimus TaxID=2904244 RepID=UPI001F489DDE|nr:hypothetical protein [Membranihabitans maritimus]